MDLAPAAPLGLGSIILDVSVSLKNQLCFVTFRWFGRVNMKKKSESKSIPCTNESSLGALREAFVAP